MCGRYSLSVSPARIQQQFELPLVPDLGARYNIAPTQAVPVVRQTGSRRELALLRWGLIPHWAREERTGYSMINARAETVAQKPAFRAAMRTRRCLVPADGFYEWRAAGRVKQPYHIRLRDADVFAFAGLWEHWTGEDGREIESFTIIVTDANEQLRPIHDRMPVILSPGDYALWLDPAVRDPQRLMPLLKPYPSERVLLTPVSPRVNSPGNDDPDCIAPVTEE
jgi:putative SOS response-associated peptidase YedK